MSGYAPRALKDSVRPRGLLSASGRPLDFTIRRFGQILRAMAGPIDNLRFAEYYTRLADDELARIALENHLVSEAQDALTDELRKRGLTDLTSYRKTLEDSLEPTDGGPPTAPLMERRTYKIHRLIACCFFVLMLIMAASYFLDWRLFGRFDRLAVDLLLIIFIVYGAFFAPTRRDMREQSRRNDR